MQGSAHHVPSAPPWLAAVGGPAAMGAALGLAQGTASVATWTAALPLIVLGVGCLMLPALYVGANLVGPAPAAHAVGRAAVDALRDTGTLFLGLAPAQAFLGVASATAEVPPLTGSILVALGASLGLRSLFQRLFPTSSRRQRLLFGLWALVSLSLGFAFFLRLPR